MKRFPTYGNLVQNDNDLIGLIAYSLYKQEKLAFVESHKAENAGEPTDGHMETFCLTSNMPTRIQAYRDAAASLLERLNNDVLESAIEQIKGDYQTELSEQVEKFEEPSMGTEILRHAIAGMIVWAIVALLIFCGIVVKKGLPDTVESLTGYKIMVPTPATEQK